MSNADNKTPENISRRAVLRAGAALGAVPVLLASQGPASAKMAQSGVAYQDAPHGSSKCGNCKLFIAPSSCKSVAGDVSANGWCKIWVKG